MAVTGIDIQKRLVDQANHGRHRPVAYRADAATWDGYGRFDIVYYNRPVDGTAMIAAEQHVMSCMRRGAVLIHVFGHADPGQSRWQPVFVKTLTPVTGVWVKP
jgi:hypothetical protein